MPTARPAAHPAGAPWAPDHPAPAVPVAPRRRPVCALVRRLALGLSVEEATFARRGFAPGDPALQAHLERIGRTFIEGYDAALEEVSTDDLGARLDATPAELRGFAYEGAAMSLALRDALAPWNRTRHARFLAGIGAPHVYMVHVGAGLALARLRLRPARYMARRDPLLAWLAVDGYGFHEGYFHPARSFARHRRPAHLRGYERRVFDQGLGRSLWFVACADVDRIAAEMRRFVPERRADLWSGVGLACAYAGAVGPSELLGLRHRAGPYRPHLAQGAAFAAQARIRAGIPAPHTDRACVALCGMTAVDAAALTEATVRDLPRDGVEPAYAVWRRRLREHFTPATQGAVP